MKAWTLADEKVVYEMVGKYKYSEIANKIGRSTNSVAMRARRLGLTNRSAVCKHKHLREKALTYYLDHTFEDTANAFNLTATELKSLLTLAYKDPNLTHLRKDKRRHDVWSLREKLTLLRLAGVWPRTAIAKKLNRGGLHSIKEECRRLGVGTKFLNGCPLRWVHAICPHVLEHCWPIKTKAGPSGGRKRGDLRFTIIPWVTLDAILARKIKPVDNLFCKYVAVMAKYQKYIYSSHNAKHIDQQIRRYACQQLVNEQANRHSKPAQKT